MRIVNPKVIVGKITTAVKQFDKIAWIKSFNFSFSYGSSLAVQQDRIFAFYKAGKPISNIKSVISELENNWWVRAAAVLAPSNLVIRQWCLIDLLKGSSGHSTDIINAVKLLSYDNRIAISIWAEGYSYWLYTKRFLNEWVVKCKDKEIRASIPIAKIDNGFMVTSYKRGNVWYPAPFGDVRDEPLEAQLQNTHIMPNVTVSCVKLEKIGEGKYTFTAKPIKLNVHIPKNNYTVSIVNGIPVGYTFYRGYDYKYPNKNAEWVDLVDPKRVSTL